MAVSAASASRVDLAAFVDAAAQTGVARSLLQAPAPTCGGPPGSCPSGQEYACAFECSGPVGSLLCPCPRSGILGAILPSPCNNILQNFTVPGPNEPNYASYASDAAACYVLVDAYCVTRQTSIAPPMWSDNACANFFGCTVENASIDTPALPNLNFSCNNAAFPPYFNGGTVNSGPCGGCPPTTVNIPGLISGIDIGTGTITNITAVLNSITLGLPPATCSAAPYYTANFSSCGTSTCNTTLSNAVQNANNRVCTPGITTVTSASCSCPSNTCALPSCGFLTGACNPNLPSPLGGLSLLCFDPLVDIAPQPCLQAVVAPYCTITQPGTTEFPVTSNVTATTPFIPSLAPGCVGNVINALVTCKPIPSPPPPSPPPPSPPSPHRCPPEKKGPNEPCLINEICCSHVCNKPPGHPLLPGKCA